MFLAVVAPWAMADMNDPAAVLIQALLRRADAARITTNVERARQGLLPYPPIIHVWTMRTSLSHPFGYRADEVLQSSSRGTAG